jgi:hypothetical protein
MLPPKYELAQNMIMYMLNRRMLEIGTSKKLPSFNQYVL